jgi:hypothetical protein
LPASPSFPVSVLKRVFFMGLPICFLLCLGVQCWFYQLRGGYPHKSPHHCGALYELELFIFVCDELSGLIKGRCTSTPPPVSYAVLLLFVDAVQDEDGHQANQSFSRESFYELGDVADDVGLRQERYALSFEQHFQHYPKGQ